MIKANIILINCFSGNPVPPDAPPYGLLYVGSALDRAGHNVKIFDRHLDVTENLDLFLKDIIKEDCDIYGLGGVASAYKDAIEISRYLKDKKPNCKIMVGGYLGTAKIILKNAPVDVIVRGEAEITAPELVDALMSSKALDYVHGITFLKDNDYHLTPARGQIGNLDDIPFPNYSLVELHRYLISAEKAMYFRRDPRHVKYRGFVIDIKTSRGCTHSCSFCYRHVKGIRQHSPEYVLDLMQYLHKTYNTVFFNISDELTLSDNIEWGLALCRLIEERKVDFLFRITSARVDMVDEGILTKLRDAGMVAMNFGIESGSQTMLNNMRKFTTVEQNHKALRLCKDLGIQTTIALVLGLPGENWKTIYETAIFLAKCPHYPNSMEYDQDDITDIRIFTCVAFPGTTLYKQGVKMGIIRDEHEYLSLLGDNDVMRSFNFTGYPDYILKLWIHILYFSYRMAYFVESGEYLNGFRYFMKTPGVALRLVSSVILNKTKQILRMRHTAVKRDLTLKPSEVLNVNEDDRRD